MKPGQETAKRHLEEAMAELNEAAVTAALHGLDQVVTVRTILLHGTEARPVNVYIKAEPLPYEKG